MPRKVDMSSNYFRTDSDDDTWRRPIDVDENIDLSDRVDLGAPKNDKVSAWWWLLLGIMLASGVALVAISTKSLSGKEITNPVSGNLLNKTESVLGVVGGGVLTIVTIGAGIKFNKVRNQQRHNDLSEENMEEL